MGFLVPLVVGFAIDVASALTTAFCKRWGNQRRRQVTFVLRNVLGIPLWVVGLGLAMRTGSPALFAAAPGWEVLAWLLLSAGSGIQLFALLPIRARAAIPSTRDTLVERGAYAHIRHPFCSVLFLRPTRAVALACLIGVAWVHVQARCEEFDLLQRLPACRGYMKPVPRFLPRIHARRLVAPEGR